MLIMTLTFRAAFLFEISDPPFHQVVSPAGLQERAAAGDPKAKALLSSGMLAAFGRSSDVSECWSAR